MTPIEPGPSLTADSPNGGRFLTPMVAFVAVLVVSAFFDHSRDWNSASRLLLTHAIVDHHTVRITRYVSDGRGLLEHPPTRDLAQSADGEYYCDKAPGISIVGVIPYVGWRRWTADDAEAGVSTSDYWVTLGSAGLASALSASLIARLALSWGASATASLAVALSASIGSYAQVYGSLFYGHALAGCLILASFILVTGPTPNSLRLFLAGVVAGSAIAVEYTAAVVLASISVGAVIRFISRRDGLSILALVAGLVGSAIPLALLGVYHTWVTGSPFQVPYTLEVDELFAYHREGTGIPIGAPTLTAIVGLILGPTTGLVWYAPTLLASIPGLWILARRGQFLVTAMIVVGAVSLFVVIAGFPTWTGGLATGPRLLLPALPLAMVPGAVWLTNARPAMRMIWVLTAWIAGGWVTMIHAAGGRMMPTFTNPWTEFLAPAFEEGRWEGHVGDWLFRSVGIESPTIALVGTLIIIGAIALGSLALVRQREHAR